MARPKPWKPAGDKSAIVAAIPAACSDERTAVEFMERQRWGDSPACPRCGDTDVYHVIDQGYGHVAALLPHARTIATCHDLMLLRSEEGGTGFRGRSC